MNEKFIKSKPVEGRNQYKSVEEMNKAIGIFQDDQKCLHKSCPDCEGSGRKKNGQLCVHMISCPCRRCTFTF